MLMASEADLIIHTPVNTVAAEQHVNMLLNGRVPDTKHGSGMSQPCEVCFCICSVCCGRMRAS